MVAKAKTNGHLKPDPHNARKHGDRNRALIRQSLQEVGGFRSIAVDGDDIIRAGNGVYEQAKELGYTVRVVEAKPDELIAVKRPDLRGKKAERAALLDNRAGELSEWDDAVIAEIAQNERDLLDGMFSDDELAALFQHEPLGAGGGASDGINHQSLSDRFIIPPFSVLDARQGYWQERKRAWLALGIQSELGRGEGLLLEAEQVTADGLNYYRNLARQDGRHGALTVSDTVHRLKPSADQARKRGLARTFGQDLMRGEHVVGGLTWVSGAPRKDETSGKNFAAGRKAADQRSNLNNAPSKPPRAVSTGTENMAAGTSIFDPVLCELAYRWFCPSQGTILDPFAGGSVRGIVASYLGYGYTGVDLRAEQVAANEAQAEAIVPNNRPRWLTGDSRNLASLYTEQTDLIFSCPPYFDLELYSEDERDLSNSGDYAAFLEAYHAIIAQCVATLKPNRFACFVVGDVRDKKGFYRNFPADTIAAFQDAGMTLYNEAVLITAVGSLPIRVGKQFGNYRKLGKTHQNVLVFYRGDPKAIASELGEVEVAELEGAQEVGA